MSENFYDNQNNEFDPAESADIDNGVYAEQRIELDNYSVSKPESDKKGVRIFCILLASAIIISSCAVGGYYIGRNSALSPKGEYSDQILEGKPSNADDGKGASNYAAIANSIVTVHVYNDEGEEAVVSGMVYSENGYIVTVDSVYKNITAAKFKVYTADAKEYSATFVGGDARTDISVIKIEEDVKLTPIKLGNSDETVAGEAVFAIAHPNGFNEKPIISDGIVSASYIRIKNPATDYSINMIQTTVNANPGDFGGALVNSYGQIIGMLSLSKSVTYDYNGYPYPIELDDSVCAVPSVTLKKIVEAIIKDGKAPNRARIGITYYVKNNVDVQLEKLPAAGLMIASVAEESELHSLIKEGDIITKINDKETLTDNIVLDILDELKPGDTISLTVVAADGTVAVHKARLLSYESETAYSLFSEKDDTSSEDNLLPF